MPLPPEARILRVPGADHAVFDLPTCRLIVKRGHNDAHGDPEELRRFAWAVLAACHRVEGDPPDWWPVGFLDVLAAEGI
ncbi:hypothetical protein J2X65_003133 [Ancylobacter sp. 3268]|uniref:hypothetical protein n=1 Tax=Ancylobacter sp. 3268 TaxID=2817752 RepID=UPI0028651831|nr:hypothetical protein [Ancylobacter sp. 3268]MDR6953770.1 hypothetical protein [Ancylobacter sp. 3268]